MPLSCVSLSGVSLSETGDAVIKILGRRSRGETSSKAAAIDGPRVGTKVRLRLILPSSNAEDLIVEVPTMVEDVEEAATSQGRSCVLISATDVSFLPSPPDLTVEHALVWIARDGQMEIPVLLSGLVGPVWRLTLNGPVRRVQRRNYVRVQVTLPASILLLDRPVSSDEEDPDDTSDDADTLDSDDAEADAEDADAEDADAEDADADDQPTRLEVTVIDLGEGGIRCVVKGVPPPQGARIVVILGHDDSVIECPGVVIRHLTVNNRDPDFTTLAIRFDDPERHGDTIRRMVFAEQLRLRQNRLEPKR
ncbi:MAG: hypothetical protein QG622_3384 [Actinomycetota bacterium]|nr:hypothetical protein [Actinomycetota bacterium]